jgi:molybdopterin-synthase adenylyltransferase
MSSERQSHTSGGRGAARVAVIGVGGLGCPAALRLADAGVGSLTLVDPDRVESSNLPRQLLHGETEIGRPKVESAAQALRRLYPDTEIRTRQTTFDRGSGAAILAAVDLAIDATDGIESKLAINDVAVERKVPFCHAGVLGLAGQAMLVVPGRTPCLRCLFPGVADDGAEWATCRQAGIVGPVAGLFGALEANLALSYLQGEHGVAGVLISYDRRADRWRQLDLSSVRRCRRCSPAETDAKGDIPTWAM